MKQTSIKPIFVDIIPDRLEAGVLYICEQYKTAAHKCCCGCGEEVITPLTPADWSIRKVENAVSLTPSIGNWNFACKSHYFITENRVLWARGMSQWQIDRVRARDKADKQAYIKEVNRQKSRKTRLSAYVSDFWKAFICWLGF